MGVEDRRAMMEYMKFLSESLTRAEKKNQRIRELVELLDKACADFDEARELVSNGDLEGLKEHFGVRD